MINLSKQVLQEQITINLSKKGFNPDVVAKVCMIIDGSSSMDSLYRNGTVGQLVNRALVIGDKFDDDGAIDMFAFSNRTKHLPQATQEDFGSYTVPLIGGGTLYSPVLREMVEFYSHKEVTKRRGGFLGLFGKKVTEIQSVGGRDGVGDNYPIFCLFVTDGVSLEPASDKAAIEKLLSENRNLFIQFVGLGKGVNEGYLESLTKYETNADYFIIKDLNTYDDNNFYRDVLSEKAVNVLNSK